MNRRDFLKATSVAPLLPGADPTSRLSQGTPTAENDRAIWISILRKLADPVLTNLANGTLKARMPVEQAAGANRQNVTHLEAAGRLLAGLAPWIELVAVLRDRRSSAAQTRRDLGSPARGLRAPAARRVVQRRWRLWRRPAVSLGLLQQLRDPPDAARCPRRLPG